MILWIMLNGSLVSLRFVGACGRYIWFTCLFLMTLFALAPLDDIWYVMACYVLDHHGLFCISSWSEVGILHCACESVLFVSWILYNCHLTFDGSSVAFVATWLLSHVTCGTLLCLIM